MPTSTTKGLRVAIIITTVNNIRFLSSRAGVLIVMMLRYPRYRLAAALRLRRLLLLLRVIRGRGNCFVLLLFKEEDKEEEFFVRSLLVF